MATVTHQRLRGRPARKLVAVTPVFGLEAPVDHVAQQTPLDSPISLTRPMGSGW